MQPQKNSQTETSTNIQNNLNIQLAPDIFNSITKLDKQNPELAKKAIELIEYDIIENHKEKQTILNLEKEEQLKRHNELPFIRKYSFIGQTFAFIIGLAGLGSAVYFGYIGMEKASIASITTTLGVLAINFISKK